MSLSCDYGDGAPEFWFTRERVARKAHVCSGCGRGITPGSPYEYSSGKQDGYFFVIKHCETCADIAAAISALGYCMDTEDMPGNYREYLCELVPWSRAHSQGEFRLPNGRTIDEQVERVFPRAEESR